MDTDETRIRFHSGSVELDGRLAIPETCTRAVVLCHPHPLYGGDMDNPVVVAVTRALADAGIATLRFDFRGVGQSGGSHGGGGPEVDDARAAVDALSQATGLTDIVVAGYSFGSVVALRLAAGGNSRGGPGHDGNRVRVAAVAAIAPPLVMFDAGLAAGLAAGLPMPLLMLAGERDTFCPRPDFQALAASLPASTETVVVPGADHFFAGREAEVAAAVLGWIQRGT